MPKQATLSGIQGIQQQQQKTNIGLLTALGSLFSRQPPPGSLALTYQTPCTDWQFFPYPFSAVVKLHTTNSQSIRFHVSIDLLLKSPNRILLFSNRFPISSIINIITQEARFSLWNRKFYASQEKCCLVMAFSCETLFHDLNRKNNVFVDIKLCTVNTALQEIVVRKYSKSSLWSRKLKHTITWHHLRGSIGALSSPPRLIKLG